VTKTVLGIDPGTGKCGVAVLASGDILHRSVIDSARLIEELPVIARQYAIDLVVVGNGTNSKAIQSAIREALPGRALLIVDETDTTIRARERYWQHTPRRGWRRLLPSSMQVPPVPVDDFVAVILAERALKVD
jgi:RNase H-fold protein (predicted Holliday junction resolvase)